MPIEVIFKKLEQIGALLNELEQLLNTPFEEFERDTVKVRAAERNFQLAVDLAIDINIQILLERSKKTPDTYRQSFTALGDEGIMATQLADRLATSAGLRNILVHEYDFEEDCRKFYDSVKEFTQPYREYLKIIHHLFRESAPGATLDN